MLNVIRIAKSITISQIEDFPADIERSFDGSLHVRPGGIYRLNDAELAHLENNHPDLLMRVIRRSKDQERSAKRAQKEEEKQQKAKKKSEYKKIRDAEKAKESTPDEHAFSRDINLVKEGNDEPSE